MEHPTDCTGKKIYIDDLCNVKNADGDLYYDIEGEPQEFIVTSKTLTEITVLPTNQGDPILTTPLNVTVVRSELSSLEAGASLEEIQNIFLAAEERYKAGPAKKRKSTAKKVAPKETIAL